MAEEQNQNQQTDNGPDQIERPAQYPTATRVENGIAYDQSGKALGSVDGQAAQPKDDSFFASLGGKTVSPQQEQKGDDFFASLGGQMIQGAHPAQVGPATSISARTPGVWERIKNAVTEGIPAFNSDFEAKATAADVTGTPYTGPKMQLITPEAAMTSQERREHPIATGIAETAGGLTTPESVLMLAGSAGLGQIGAAGKAILPRLVSAGFSAQALVGAYKQVPEFKAAMDRGDESEAERILTHIVLDTGMGVLAGEHGVRGEVKPFTSIDRTVGKITDRVGQRTVDAFKPNVDALDSATKRHQTAQTVYDVRSEEVNVANDQVVNAKQKLDAARQDLADGKQNQKQVEDAQSNLSAAAANANKAIQALGDAHEVRATAAADVDRFNRKINQTPKVNEKNHKKLAGAEEDFRKIAPPTATGPGAYTDKDYQIGRRYLEEHHQNIEQIGSKQGLYDALDHTQKSMENQIKPYVEKYANEPIASDPMMDVRDALAESPRADFIEKGMNHILETYPQIEDGTLTIAESEKIGADLNAANRAALQKNWGDVATALKADPEFAARYALADSLRNGRYDLFEEKEVRGIRELRQDEASIIRLRNAVQRGITKGGTRVRGSGESGRFRQAAAWTTQKGSTALGAKLAGPKGAVVGEMAGERLGRIIAPGDLTQDQLVQRMMKPRGGGVPTTGIVGPGMPSTAQPRGLALSPRDMQMVMREYSPLHSDLATHYGESVGDSTYHELEQRFMNDIADKQQHGVTLESPEKQILKQINQANAADLVKAHETAQQEAVSGKKIGSYNLPDRVEPVLEANRKLPNGMNTREALVHDLAHIVVGNENGIDFEDGIRSHLHPENKGSGRVMTAPINWEPFVDEEGNIDFDKLSKSLPELASTYVAGGVANDLFHEVPFTENHGLGADMSVLKSFMKKAGFSDHEASKLIAQAAEDAATILSRPGTREILEGHAALREAGLNEKYHFSPERVEQVLQDLKEGTKYESTARKSARTSREGSGAASKPGAGAEGQAKDKSSESVSKEGKGSPEAKEGRPGTANESANGTAASGAPESNNPAVSTVVQGGHAGGGVVSEEELARPGRFVKISRSGAPTDQGKTPDFNLGAGEAGYQVRPGGKYELKAGQETPATKRGVEGYARELHGNAEPSNPAFSTATAEPETERLPKVENLRVPPERTTGQYDAPIKQGGAIPGGIQKGDAEIDIPDLALFHDPTTGSTLALPVDKISPENVKTQLRNSRAQYIAGEDRKAAARADVATAADEFNRRQGRPVIDTATKPHSVEFAKRVADSYDQMQHNPTDPKVKAAYDAMKKDVDQQWDYATKDMGVKLEPWTEEGQPYANSKQMVEDVKNNKHLYFFQGGDFTADNPLKTTDPKTGLSYMDKFRAVHDLFGHAAQGNQFGPKGEETAYQLHRQMFSPEAVPALTSETRGQNSWVNFGKHLRDAQGNIPAKGETGHVPVAERPYAQQKAGLLPEEFHQAEPQQHWSEKIADNLDKQPAGGINPHIPDASSKRYGFEILPEARKALDSNPTAEHFRQYADQHQQEIGSHPDIKLGWDTTGPKPELNIGAATDDLEKAKQMAAKLDQRALWDNKEEKVVDVGGKGEKTAFPEYPFEQRLKDLEAKSENYAYHPDLQKLVDKFGTTTDPTSVRRGASFVAPDGKFIPLGSTEHPVAIESVTNRGGDAEAVGARMTRSENTEIHNPETGKTEPVDSRIGFMRDTGAIRTRFRQSMAGKELVVSIPAKGITEDQISALRQAVGQGLGRNGNLLMEVGEAGGKSATKEFASPRDVEPMLREIGAHPEQVESLNPAFAVKGSSVPLMENPLKVKGTGDQGRISTIDVSKALQKFSKKSHPALEMGKADPGAQVDRARKIAEDEAKYQLNQANSGKAWYTTDIADHDKILQEIRPELTDPAKLSVFKMAEAVLSSGQKPYSNLKSAIKAWDYYNETGEFSPMNPDTKMSWGPRNFAAYGNALQMINRLVQEQGEKGASNWLLSEHPVTELKDYNKDVKGKKDDNRLGAIILGEKRGPFAQNLHGMESAFTADMWVNRTWNRWMGTQEIASDGELRDSPRNMSERNLMKQSFAETANKLGLTTSSLQAVLWYYEQSLYGAHGVPKESWNFADAARRIQKEHQAADAASEPRTETVHPGAIHAFDFLRSLGGAR